MVTAFKPFYNIPVRRQLAQKNAPQTASKIQETLIAYGLIHPKVRFVLLHTQSTVGTKKKPQNWIKPTVADQMEDIKVIFGKHLADMLHHVSMDEPDGDRDDTEDADGDSGNIHLDAVLPIKGSGKLAFSMHAPHSVFPITS
jgi:DNA mismatch repair ATPase MutL